jgi:hypothetical protein
MSLSDFLLLIGVLILIVLGATTTSLLRDILRELRGQNRKPKEPTNAA